VEKYEKQSQRAATTTTTTTIPTTTTGQPGRVQHEFSWRKSQYISVFQFVGNLAKI
jgi:hypothetical protein